MNRDRSEIVGILKDMNDSKEFCEIHPNTVAINKLEQYVEKERAEAIGWTYAEACTLADGGRDIRRVEVPSILSKAYQDLNLAPKK